MKVIVEYIYANITTFISLISHITRNIIDVIKYMNYEKCSDVRFSMN